MGDAERAMKRARAACTCLILVSSEVREREIDRERAPPPHVVCLRCEERERERLETTKRGAFKRRANRCSCKSVVGLAPRSNECWKI